MRAMGVAARDWNLQGAAAFALLPLCGAVGALIAVPFGLIALRVRRHTFIVITIAIFFIFQLMAFNFWFTGGSSGQDAPFLNGSPAGFNRLFYYIALGYAAATIAVSAISNASVMPTSCPVPTSPLVIAVD